jgi:hypothetical protein
VPDGLMSPIRFKQLERVAATQASVLLLRGISS